MAFSKANRYELDAQRRNELFKAVSYPARQKIIEQLSVEGPCTVQELCKKHPISRTTMSFHLKILRECNLVSCEEKFPHTYYELNWEKIEEAKELLGGFFTGLVHKAGQVFKAEGTGG